MQEIEIRAVIPDPKVIQMRLFERGFELVGSLHQTDIIFDRPDASLFNSGRKIRIRIEGDSAELTYKGPFTGNDEASRRSELNLSISPEQVSGFRVFLEALGYPVCFVVPKRRTILRRSRMKVTFDDWPMIGCLVEIEGDEREARQLASEIAPEIQFGNYRLRELIRREEARSGLSLEELQARYESEHGVKLGNIKLLLE